jgi:hypothetical protein
MSGMICESFTQAWVFRYSASVAEAFWINWHD